MKFLAITLIVHPADPITGVQKSTTDRFREVIANALMAEELGFEQKLGLQPVFTDLDDFAARSSALTPWPAEVSADPVLTGSAT